MKLSEQRFPRGSSLLAERDKNISYPTGLLEVDYAAMSQLAAKSADLFGEALRHRILTEP